MLSPDFPNLQKENRNLSEKMEMLEQEYKKVRKALEIIMPVIMEKIDDDKDFKRKEQLMVSREELIC